MPQTRFDVFETLYLDYLYSVGSIGRLQWGVEFIADGIKRIAPATEGFVDNALTKVRSLLDRLNTSILEWECVPEDDDDFKSAIRAIAEAWVLENEIADLDAWLDEIGATWALPSGGA